MALTIKIDFKLEKIIKNDSGLYAGRQYFLSPTELESIFTALQVFIEERSLSGVNGRVELPLGIDKTGRYVAPSIWDQIEVDLKDFSELYPEYYFKLKLVVDGHTVFYKFFAGRQENISKNEFSYHLSKKYFCFICVDEAYFSQAKALNLQQLIALSSYQFSVQEELILLTQFCTELFDEDQDYYANNLIYVPFDKFNSFEYEYKAIKVDADKKAKKLDTHYFNLSRVQRIFDSLKYAEQQTKFMAYLQQYPIAQQATLQEQYQKMLGLCQHAAENGLAILLTLVPQGVNLDITNE